MYKYKSNAGVTLISALSRIWDFETLKSNGIQCNIKWKMAAVSYEKLHSLKLVAVDCGRSKQRYITTSETKWLHHLWFLPAVGPTIGLVGKILLLTPLVIISRSLVCLYSSTSTHLGKSLNPRHLPPLKRISGVNVGTCPAVNSTLHLLSGKRPSLVNITRVLIHHLLSYPKQILVERNISCSTSFILTIKSQEVWD
jgi:hypothetical protein